MGEPIILKGIKFSDFLTLVHLKSLNLTYFFSPALAYSYIHRSYKNIQKINFYL